jgi:hypothetical protein
VRRAARPLAVEELRGRQRRRPERLGRHLDPARREPRAEVARRVDRVVGQDQEALAGGGQAADEVLGARQRPLLVDQDAVHVEEVVLEVAHGRLPTRVLGGASRNAMVVALSCCLVNNLGAHP